MRLTAAEKAQQKAYRGRRIKDTVDLMETLVSCLRVASRVEVDTKPNRRIVPPRRGPISMVHATEGTRKGVCNGLRQSYIT